VSDPREAFLEAVQQALGRYAAQNGISPWPANELRGVGERLWALMAERGLPPPLPPGEMGAPGELSAEEVAPLVAAALAATADAAKLAKPVQQLVKACFYPEFRKCRDSYRETEADGTCRRQQWSRGRERISGAHCVDCPYWQALTPAQHERLLARAWVGDDTEWNAHREGFLPNDFREIRRIARTVAATRT